MFVTTLVTHKHSARIVQFVRCVTFPAETLDKISVQRKYQHQLLTGEMESESWPCFDTLAESAPSYKLKTRPIKSFAPFSSTFRNVVPERIAVDSETNYNNGQ